MPAAVTAAEAGLGHQMSSVVRSAEARQEASSVTAGSEIDSDLVVFEFFVHSI